MGESRHPPHPPPAPGGKGRGKTRMRPAAGRTAAPAGRPRSRGAGAGGALSAARRACAERMLPPPLAPPAPGLYGENMAPFPEEVDVFSAPHWRMKQLVGLYCDKVAGGGGLRPAHPRREGGGIPAARGCQRPAAPAPAPPATSPRRCRGAPRPFPPRAAGLVVPPSPPRPARPPFRAGTGLRSRPPPQRLCRAARRLPRRGVPLPSARRSGGAAPRAPRLPAAFPLGGPRRRGGGWAGARPPNPPTPGLAAPGLGSGRRGRPRWSSHPPVGRGGREWAPERP